MTTHEWVWDGQPGEPVHVRCIKCHQVATLREVLDHIGCNGCPGPPTRQAKLFEEERRALQKTRTEQ